MTIAFDDRLTLPDSVLLNELDGESVLLNLQTEAYFGLDEVGTRMLRLATSLASVEATVPALLAEFDVDEARLRQDLLTLLDELLANGLVALDHGQAA